MKHCNHILGFGRKIDGQKTDRILLSGKDKKYFDNKNIGFALEYSFVFCPRCGLKLS
jgi:hypothetical protein